MALKLALENTDTVKEILKIMFILQDIFSIINCIPNIAVTTKSDKYVNVTCLNSQEMVMTRDGFKTKGGISYSTHKSPKTLVIQVSNCHPK